MSDFRQMYVAKNRDNLLEKVGLSLTLPIYTKKNVNQYMKNIMVNEKREA